MKTLNVTIKEKVAIVALDKGSSNAMNAEMIQELQDIVVSIENDDTIKGIILTGKKGFFSAGLDLIELYNYSEQEMEAFWVNFLKLVSTLVAFKKPLIAAISGHSPAGGCVLALCCDYRVMAQGNYVIGLNEVPVGIIVPKNIFDLYAFWIGKRKAYQNLLEGKLLSAEEAKIEGLIDEVVDISVLMTVAEKKMQTYLSYDGVTWQQSKINIRRSLLKKVSEDQTEAIAKLLEQWWSPSTRSILNTIINNLKSK